MAPKKNFIGNHQGPTQKSILALRPNFTHNTSILDALRYEAFRLKQCEKKRPFPTCFLESNKNTDPLEQLKLLEQIFRSGAWEPLTAHTEQLLNQGPPPQQSSADHIDEFAARISVSVIREFTAQL